METYTLEWEEQISRFRLDLIPSAIWPEGSQRLQKFYKQSAFKKVDDV